ncbi:Pentatricopeptide repeat-containing protein [Platanthera guangdongensis]|uniref:Pentatricopeptide repeat-containing protein n=1 Tax=Platanthera guangdongensis TaxID=2320717 RepID=A0ABR2MVJ9_9ASPA
MRGRRFFSASVLQHRLRDSYDYTQLLHSSSDLQTLKLIHAQIFAADLHQNPFLAAKLVSRYADLGSDHMIDARKVFDGMHQRDPFLYNVVIRGYAASGLPGDAVTVYARMFCQCGIRPNFYTFPFILKACAAAGQPKLGRAVHAHALRACAGGNLFIINALIAFYAKCGMVEIARMVFDRMRTRDLVSWNSAISGYAQNGYGYEALVLFHRMFVEIMPDYVTLLAVLPACMAMAAITEGMWIHSYALKKCIGIDAAVGSGLIDMYANCGRLSVARKVFDAITEKNLIVYTSMIRALGMHGHGLEALETFTEMLMIGIKPDSVCFVSVLSACSHGGLVEEAIEIFEKMDSEHGVEKGEMHYACMVDLLGRAGKLTDALEFIGRMSGDPGEAVLGAFVGACKARKNIDLGEEAAKRLLLLDPKNAGRYAMLTKIYEDLGRWEDAARVRKVMKDRGVRKPLGCSMVEVAAKMHTFGVEDEAHPMTCEIYDTLERLQRMVDEANADFTYG